MEKIYVKLAELSAITGLPKATIKRLADEGRLPALKLSRGYRFNPAAVLAKLNKIASAAKRG